MQIEFHNGKFVALDTSGNVIASASSKYYLKQKLAKTPAVASAVTPVSAVASVINPALEFAIAKRFDFVRRYVRMVAKKKTASAIITGDGGLGKSHTVIQAIRDAGLKEIRAFEADEAVSSSNVYTVVKGYSTAKGLFRTLHDFRNAIIVFDDCDSILKDPDAVNLLKGALDSYDERVISWNADRLDPELDRSFRFTGGIIFISNRAMHTIDQALRTRAMCVDVSMTLDQKIERMEMIMSDSDFLPQVPMPMKRDALSLIAANKTVAREVSLRTLIAVTKIRAEGDQDWEDMARYSLIAG